MKCVNNVDAGTLTFKFEDGRVIFIDTSKIHANESEHIFFYGAKQKLVDAAASALKRSAENGLDIESQRFEMIQEMWSRMQQGTAFERSTDGAGRISYLIKAIAELYNLSESNAAEKIKAKSEEDQKALAVNPKVQAVILRLKAEAAAAALAKMESKVEDEDEELPEL